MDMIECTTNLTSLIKAVEVHLPHSDPHCTANSIVRSHHRQDLCVTTNAQQECLPEPQPRAMKFACLKVASSTLMMIPVVDRSMDSTLSGSLTSTTMYTYNMAGMLTTCHPPVHMVPDTLPSIRRSANSQALSAYATTTPQSAWQSV